MSGAMPLLLLYALITRKGKTTFHTLKKRKVLFNPFKPIYLRYVHCTSQSWKAVLLQETRYNMAVLTATRTVQKYCLRLQFTCSPRGAVIQRKHFRLPGPRAIQTPLDFGATEILLRYVDKHFSFSCHPGYASWSSLWGESEKTAQCTNNFNTTTIMVN